MPIGPSRTPNTITECLISREPSSLNFSPASPALTGTGLWDEWKNRETAGRLLYYNNETNDFATEVYDFMRVLLTEDQFKLGCAAR